MARIERFEFKLRVLNWNIGGAKYLESPRRERESFKSRLNKAITHLIIEQSPDVITLQEVTEVDPKGDQKKATCVLRTPKGYRMFLHRLIDTDRHSHQGKWKKVRDAGLWPPMAFFSQGNAMLVREGLNVFPVWSTPERFIDYEKWLVLKQQASPETPALNTERSNVEHVPVYSGLYFGNRDTEPRSASVLHLVVDQELPNGKGLDKPLDVFVINTHLTTLTNERAGIPSVDARASKKRLDQLSLIFDEIISPYMEWRKSDFLIRGHHHVDDQSLDSHVRHKPIWVLAGDLNFTPESPEYRFVKERNYHDMYDVPNRKHTKAKGLKKDPTHTLDYVFVGPLFESLNPKDLTGKTWGEVVTHKAVRVSDHYPVVVEIPIKLEIDENEPQIVECTECDMNGMTSPSEEDLKSYLKSVRRKK